jgi:serralysin
MSANPKHFCMCPTPADLSPEDKKRLAFHRAALLKSAKWNPGDVITARFLEGDPALQARVKAVALEWTGPRMANLTLDFRKTGPTDIRIAFRQGNGSWSYLGTMCRQIAPESEPTMNYGWLTPHSSEDEVRRVVLHEFGHALGLIHEHQNPNGGIPWNEDAVRHDLSGPPNNWDPATIDNNMFKFYPETDLVATDVDAYSIMMYPIPASWTTNGFSAGFNSELSATDKTLIRSVYPQ